MRVIGYIFLALLLIVNGIRMAIPGAPAFWSFVFGGGQVAFLMWWFRDSRYGPSNAIVGSLLSMCLSFVIAITIVRLSQ